MWYNMLDKNKAWTYNELAMLKLEFDGNNKQYWEVYNSRPDPFSQFPGCGCKDHAVVLSRQDYAPTHMFHESNRLIVESNRQYNPKPSLRLQISKLALVYGVAVVFDKRLTIIGGRHSVIMFAEIQERLRKLGYQMQSALPKGTCYTTDLFNDAYEMFLEYYHGEVYAHKDLNPSDVGHERVLLPKIQHKVCELFPGFRDRTNKASEVVLKPIHGGLRLGGVVWKTQTYECDEGLRYLGIK